MEGDYYNFDHNGLQLEENQAPRRSFFNNIGYLHGTNIRNLLRNWTSLRYDLASAKAHLNYLLQCRKQDVFPSHILNTHRVGISFRSKSCNFFYKSSRVSLERKILKLEIKDLHIHINKFLYKKLNNLIIKIRNIKINNITLDNFLKFTEIKSRNIYNNTVDKLQKKFFNLIKNQRSNNRHQLNRDNWIKNISDVQIPDDVIDVASLGPKFNVPKIDLSSRDVLTSIKNIEYALDSINIDKNIVDDIRESFVGALEQSAKKVDHIPQSDRDFAKKLSNTKLFLKNNNNIFFTRADKGNLTVCMNVSDYKLKMNTLFQDKKFYSVCKRSPLKSLQNKVHKILSSFNDNEYLNRSYHNFSLTQSNTVLPKAYGLPKIHKPDIPIRPIISTINSPTHFLAKIIDKELRNCVKKPVSQVNNSYELISKLTHVVVPPDFVLLSLDVSSLFTNVPCELVIHSLDKRFSDIHNISKIPFSEIVDSVKFLFDNTFFTFDGIIYKQVFGTPMGSPISPLFADIVMSDLEENCLNILRNNHNCIPLFYFRYVDDTILCVNKDHVDLVLEVFNNYNNHLKFTHELEDNNIINFLDVSLIRDNNKIITNWYQKPMCSGRLLNFKSNHTMQQKRNIISNLVDRSFLLSDKKFHSNNLKLIYNMLIDNNYPKKFIDDCVQQRLRKHKYKSFNMIINIPKPKPFLTVSLPYHRVFYPKISKVLKKYNIRTAPLINQKLNSIVKLGKDKTDKWDETDIVYSFSCDSCPATYIGQTKRSLKTRISEHIKQVNKNLPVPNHLRVNPNHSFKWDETVILDRESNYKKRLISEMIHINSENNTINRCEDTQYLNIHYKKIKKIF